MPSSSETTAAVVNAACARTLAGVPDLQVDLTGHDGFDTRGMADAIACHSRFRLPDTARQMCPDGPAGRLFMALDEARAETLGARWLPGIAHNLTRRPGDLSNAETRLRTWAWATNRGTPSSDCPPATRAALLGLSLCLDHPQDYARLARDLSLALVEAVVTDRSGKPTAPDPSPPSAYNHDASADQVKEDSEGKPQIAESAEDGNPGVAPPPLPEALAHDYRIYTTRHDRVVQAHELADPQLLADLRARLDGELQPYRQMVARLAHQLQRLILARQRRHWALDQEEGQLDSSRLARLVADPGRAHIFRVEEEGPFRQTAVTLLLDNSGSMRGHPITVAALTADILTRSLELCGIKVEVLGYTTAAWEGGAPAQEWAHAGQPVDPGRLNAVRHIVYKGMDTPWRRARRSLGLMLKDDLLKENIDGEALSWACQRLLHRPEARRLMIVISDGAPMDKSTLAANPRAYLEQHLHRVVAWMGKNTDIELHAIGIGHQVARYYPDSVSLRNVDELGTVLFKRLGAWLA